MSPEPRQDLQTLHALTDLLSRERRLEHALRAITDTALRLLPGEHSSIRRLDAPSGVLVPVARSGLGADRRAVVIQAREGIAGWVVANARSTMVHDVRQDERFLHVVGRGWSIASMLSEPIMLNRTAIGVLSVTSCRPDQYSDQDAQLLRILANWAAPRIDLERLQRLTVVDDLTYAFNQGHLPRLLAEEQDRARHTGNPLSVAMLGLDRPGQLNEAYGRDVGDRVLETFAQRVRDQSRTYDALVRWGSDEFVLLLPETSAVRAFVVGERLRSAIGETPMEPHPGALLTQTVSIGLATWSGRETAEDLLTRAAAVMKEVKQQGGNRVARAAL